MKLLAVVLVSALAVSTSADEKKAGERLQKHGITTYEVVASGDVPRADAKTKSITVILYRGKAKFATVKVDELSHTDHIASIEPVTGEAMIVESLLSKPELTIRSGDTFVTSRFDMAAKQWKRNGSEALFLRSQALTVIVAEIIIEPQDRGLLASAPHKESADSASTPPAGRFGGVSLNLTQDPGTGGDGGSGGTCTGLRENCYAYNMLWSRACNDAKSECNSKCWNKYCIGCCKFDACNKVCALEELWCTAIVDGYSCSYNDVN